MARKVFYSFHYKADSWRVAKVKNIGAIEGQPVLTANKWEEVASKGDAAIKKWIDDNMRGKSCNIVLIGSETASRPWVDYEIRSAWDNRKGVVGIYIHNLTDQNGDTARMGANPFSSISLKDGRNLSSIVKTYNPAGMTSDAVYRTIAENIEVWVEEAIFIRNSA